LLVAFDLDELMTKIAKAEKINVKNFMLKLFFVPLKDVYFIGDVASVF
jgi:hypothetical protein